MATAGQLESRNFVVVDVGNTRIKWGLCDHTAVAAVASLPPNDDHAWQAQIQSWHLELPTSWTITGVHIARRDALAEWLRQRGEVARIVTRPDELPLKVALDQPAKVGIDRLLNAVAVNSRRPANVPAFIVDAGSAITVDFVDETGAFRGGAIMPGLNMMAEALHNYTALLPLISIDDNFNVPGASTAEAMKAGIVCAAVGGVKELMARTVAAYRTACAAEVYLGGGDAQLLSRHLAVNALLWPEMTLEGLRLATRRMDTP